MIFNGIVTNNKAKIIIRGLCDASNFTINPTERELEMGDSTGIALNSLITDATIDNLSITDNGIDVKNQFIKHTGASTTWSRYATSYTTSGTVNNSNKASNPIKVGADTTTTQTGNMYANSGSTAYIDYSFDWSALNDGVVIDSMTLTVKGHRESTTTDATHVAKLQVFCNGVAKSQAIEFTQTTDEVITVPFTGYSMTVAELKQSILRFTVAYYGGNLTGITWTINYTPLSYWSYSLNNITENHTIVIS